MKLPAYNPSYYEITVWFKPDGIPRYNASEKRKVDFEVDEELSRSEYYKKGRTEVLNQGVIDSRGINYWEPYKVDIRIPEECRNRSIDHELL